MTDYTELFKITYSGTVRDLTTRISGLTGVTNVSSSAGPSQTVDETLDCDISYDTYETDREDLSAQIEAIDGVTEVVFG
ncbi:hypothetical protein [Haloparvum sedimenti]|uniref:hypothetical protein n=1 Tax=Haloparvum sedimenti TaxID=1678448 RepID=UPI00071E929F|nr:hypothetical protein [Haloparvum sedimenti]